MSKSAINKRRQALNKAAASFRSILAINAPLNPDDERPLRDFVAGAWPSYGELRRLVAAIEAMDAVLKTTNPPVGDSR